ncbi:MAG: capsular biosynthesis protein [Thiobacillus sp.]|nr:capsular biosynthesis protein [Thiobacillus sp.]
MLNKYKKKLSFWIVGLPMVLAVAYYLLLAADRYVSESVITVKQAGDSVPSPITGLATMFGANPPSREDTLYLQEYVHSLDMLRHLEAKVALRKAYEAESLDPIYRLYAGTSQEWLHWYYTQRVELVFDDLSGLLKVRVEGFTPEFAQVVNQEILAQSERFVNEVSHRMAREQMAFAESELLRARERLQTAKSRLIAFQNRHKMLDPLAQAQATATLATQLESELAHKETELKAMLGYLQEDAYQVVSLRQQIAALKSQLEQERQKVASGQGGRLNSLASEFQNLALDVGFAEDAYKAALSAVETTRIEASRKLKSLVVVSSPAKPEIAVYPQRFYNLVTLLLGLTLLYGVVRLVIATIQDHRD